MRKSYKYGEYDKQSVKICTELECVGEGIQFLMGSGNGLQNIGIIHRPCLHILLEGESSAPIINVFQQNSTDVFAMEI